MTYDATTGLPADEAELRTRALKRIKKRREFRSHLLLYTLVNAFLVVVWAVTSGVDGYFWPVFPIVGWGIGVVANAYDVYADDVTEQEVRREMDHLAHR